MIAKKVLSSFLVSECAYFRTQFREFVLSRLWKGDGKARCMLWNTVNMECLKMRDPETDTFSGFLFRYTFPEKIRVFFLICQISELNCWQIDLLLKKNSDESVKLSGVKLVAPEHSDVFPNAVFFVFRWNLPYFTGIGLGYSHSDADGCGAFLFRKRQPSVQPSSAFRCLIWDCWIAVMEELPLISTHLLYFMYFT